MTFFALEEDACELEQRAPEVTSKLFTYDAGFGRRAFEGPEHLLVAMRLMEDGELIDA
jgi:hypothetical protein